MTAPAATKNLEQIIGAYETGTNRVLEAVKSSQEPLQNTMQALVTMVQSLTVKMDSMEKLVSTSGTKAKKATTAAAVTPTDDPQLALMRTIPVSNRLNFFATRCALQPEFLEFCCDDMTPNPISTFPPDKLREFHNATGDKAGEERRKIARQLYPMLNDAQKEVVKRHMERWAEEMNAREHSAAQLQTTTAVEVDPLA